MKIGSRKYSVSLTLGEASGDMDSEQWGMAREMELVWDMELCEWNDQGFIYLAFII